MRDEPLAHGLRPLLALALIAAGAGCGSLTRPSHAPRDEAAVSAAESALAADRSGEALEPIDDPDLLEAFDALEAAKTRADRLEALDAVWFAASDDSVIPRLAPWIRSEDPEVAIAAIAVIEQLAVEAARALPVLREANALPLAPEVKIRVLGALYELRTDAPGLEVAKAVMVAFDDPDPRVRREAAEYAGMVRDPEAIGLLRERLAVEPDASVREMIEWSIAFLRDEVDFGPAPVPALAPAES